MMKMMTMMVLTTRHSDDDGGHFIGRQTQTSEGGGTLHPGARPESQSDLFSQ